VTTRRLLAAPCAALCAGLVLAGCSSKAVKPTELTRIAYGGAVGERRVWSVEQTLRGEISFGGLPELVVVKLKGTVTETVAEALPDGGRRLRQVWTVSPPEVNGMALGAGLSATSIEAGLLRAPTGEVAPLEGSAAETDLLLWAARTFGGFFPLLPKARVATGERWTRAETAPAAGGLEVLRTVNAKLESIEGTEARISTDGSVSLVRAEPGAPIEEFRLECGGEVRFDLAGGAVLASTQDGTLRFKGRAGKMPVSARARFASKMTLKETSAK
jgi:hypothetical protein